MVTQRGLRKIKKHSLNNKDEEAVAAKNPESEEYKVNEKIKRT